ncbi:MULTISPECIES: cytochrome bc1 complex Rieske iron-sulfur subunit [Prauserella salsuginis group]|uniref:Cytochrome bc1 complex Rieske iron-sulfur subunit n=2 Tax=Prauserella salsuginis group TaxID=2893672 RepID=A0A839XMG7_9PSEU|nr:MULTISPECIES: ubiquinol-cytochrome c reductase iron-sulfur subunit [Prauserella salsuginis group]MBB3661196.1 ubiquinol-cytochrome c reductase iron-sulfur subunit [Prauserella sediminis]MCR3719057.1 ubiquinol-cytochrome c reductase iron-sulfur subunit [Prauserella flava]MCR3733627.1 ubiquinol-cytochrome c reductase iron-sulfur subunit [Prauserella salsuginis]
MSGNEPGPRPSDEELAAMSRDDLVKLGGQLDGVEIVDYPDPWPVKGTKAEKRAERAVALWFLVAALAGLAFVVALIWWPWQYEPRGNESGHFWYSLYTPVLGITMGISVLAIAFGALLYAKKFIPNETAIQQRSDNMGEGSPEVDRKTIVAHLADAGDASTIGRRSMIKRTAGLGVGALGLGVVALPVASFIKDPHANADNKDGLVHTGWQKEHPDEVVYLRRHTGDANEVSLVRPEELDAGGMETVFPFRESERGDHEALLHAVRRSDNPVMLIRLRPEDAANAVKRKGQEDFNYGDFYAFTKICSHVGCPTSLYEQQTNRILCPCHQSQFDALNYAKPVFGPATRALAQLPITVHTDGYLIARHDFIEPIGPGFWERKS